MVCLDRFGAARTSIDRVADAGIINAPANANDHGSQLAGLRMIVNHKKCVESRSVSRLAGVKFDVNFRNGFRSISIACM